MFGKIVELANHYAARAVSRSTNNRAARDRFLLTTNLLHAIAREHPGGVIVEVSI
jgi:hypothetical protein